MNGRTFICLLALLPLGALADGTVHRWVDERGVVNYGDKPPPGRKATPVPITDPLTVSRPPAPTTPSDPAAPPARAGTPPMDRDAVRQEIESSLRREQAAQAQEAERNQEKARAEARRRCEEQRRVDCDQAQPDDLYIAPPRIVRRHYPIPPVVPPRPADPPAPPVLKAPRPANP